MSRLEALHVVVPARDEAELIGRCLARLCAAREVLSADRPDLTVRVTVVLDGCVDNTAEIVRRCDRAEALEVAAFSVGGARAAGVRHVARGLSAEQAERVWVVCTDADSAVPATWLTAQVSCAEQGYAVRVGTVIPDLDVIAPALHRAWVARHDLGNGHGHVHGANLGFSLAAYLQVGGFRKLRCGEDVDLVERFREAGLLMLATGCDAVLTSGRPVGRVQGGFGDYLADLAAELAAVT